MILKDFIFQINYCVMSCQSLKVMTLGMKRNSKIPMIIDLWESKDNFCRKAMNSVFMCIVLCGLKAISIERNHIDIAFMHFVFCILY